MGFLKQLDKKAEKHLIYWHRERERERRGLLGRRLGRRKMERRDQRPRV